MANTTFNRSFLPLICIVIWIYFVCDSPWRVGIWRKQRYFFGGIGGRKGAGFMSLSMRFNQYSVSIYLRWKSYLVVKISSDIVTEHWCQVGILSMMSLLLWLLWSVCWHGKWLCNQETWVPYGLISLQQANVGNDMKKYSLHLIFTFYLNRDTSVLELFPVIVFQKKKSQWGLCWPIYLQSKLSLKLLVCSWKIKNDVHIITYYCKPELIAWP